MRGCTDGAAAAPPIGGATATVGGEWAIQDGVIITVSPPPSGDGRHDHEAAAAPAAWLMPAPLEHSGPKQLALHSGRRAISDWGHFKCFIFGEIICSRSSPPLREYGCPRTLWADVIADEP